MHGLNRVDLIGNLGRDPEVRVTPGGTTVTNFSLATNDRWRDKESGELKERTEWHRCVAWEKKAEVLGEHLKKGSQVFITGKLKTREWTDSEGVKRYTTEIEVKDFKMLGGKPATEGFAPGDRPEPAPDQLENDIPF